VSAIVSIEGTNNFQEHYSPAIGASISHAFADRLQTYVVPLWVHNPAASSAVTRETVIVGVAGQLRVLPTVYIAAEVTPRVGGYAPGDPEYGFALVKRVGGHTFMLTFTNTTEGTTYAGLARGAAPGGLFLGFNLSRKFF
jgi:hypothetical protein